MDDEWFKMDSLMKDEWFKMEKRCEQFAEEEVPCMQSPALAADANETL